MPYIFMVNRFNGKSRTFIVITASLNDQQGKMIAKKKFKTNMKMNKRTKKTRRGNCVSDLTNKKKHQIQRIGIEICFKMKSCYSQLTARHGIHTTNCQQHITLQQSGISSKHFRNHHCRTSKLMYANMRRVQNVLLVHMPMCLLEFQFQFYCKCSNCCCYCCCCCYSFFSSSQRMNV